MKSSYIAWPLKRHDICVMSDGAAVCLLASEKAAEKFCENQWITGIGAGSDCMRFWTDHLEKCRCCRTKTPKTTRI